VDREREQKEEAEALLGPGAIAIGGLWWLWWLWCCHMSLAAVSWGRPCTLRRAGYDVADDR